MPRPPKKHEHVNASFYDVLKAVSGSKYKDEKAIKKKLKAKKKAWPKGKHGFL